MYSDCQNVVIVFRILVSILGVTHHVSPCVSFVSRDSSTGISSSQELSAAIISEEWRSILNYKWRQWPISAKNERLLFLDFKTWLLTCLNNKIIIFNTFLDVFLNAWCLFYDDSDQLWLTTEYFTRIWPKYIYSKRWKFCLTSYLLLSSCPKVALLKNLVWLILRF